MAKDVTVKFIGAKTFGGKAVTKGMTQGRIYPAKMPVVGEIDPHGWPVRFNNELWVEADDVGETVVTRLSDGFELV